MKTKRKRKISQHIKVHSVPKNWVKATI